MTLLPAALRRPFSISMLAVIAVVVPSAPLRAQQPQLVQSIPDPNDPVERLGRYIRILASSPRDLEALLGAGQAALDVGDANAALGFYARAEEVSPSNGRVKAGLGSSLVMIERPDDALRLFAQAVAMGVPEAAVARDRGLAYDLRGDSRRAQHDYALAMTRGRDDELVRRYALSMGISGDRAGAMALLDPLLRKQDQGAWRARAFIMAMNGDVAGANGVARQLMVPAMANAMSPLLSRLASLNPAERAHAINFGTVPADGTQLAVQTGDPFIGAVPPATSAIGGRGLVSSEGLSRPPVVSGDAGLIPTGEPLGPRPVDVKPVRVAQADSAAPRRRPGELVTASTPQTAAPAATVKPSPGFTSMPDAIVPTRRIGARIGPVDPALLPPEARGEVTQVVRVDSATLPPPDAARPLLGPPTGPQVAQAPATNTAPSSAPPVQIAKAELPPSAAATTPAFEVPPATTAPATGPAPQPGTTPIPTSATTPASRLAGLLEGIEREPETAVALPNAAELRAARAAAKKKMAQLAAQTAAEEAAKREAAEKLAAAKRNPARVWVQVATGRNDSGLGITLKRIRSDNESALKGLSGWSAPYKATNRILVGPMKSAAAARELVAKLAKNGVSAMTFSSDAGEEVEKIAAK
jgi:Flp pilus assembly protein TadD